MATPRNWAFATLLGLAVAACSPPDPMARQPDPETHPARKAADEAKDPQTPDPSGAPLTTPGQRPDTPPEEDPADEAMPPPNPPGAITPDN